MERKARVIYRAEKRIYKEDSSIANLPPRQEVSYPLACPASPVGQAGRGEHGRISKIAWESYHNILKEKMEALIRLSEEIMPMKCGIRIPVIGGSGLP